MVEDDKATRRALVLLMKHRGYDTIEAGTVEEGIGRLGEQPDWVILDLMLPDGNGVSVLESIRNRQLAIKVAVTTGMHPEDLRNVQRALPDIILQKPYKIEDLLDQLRI